MLRVLAVQFFFLVQSHDKLFLVLKLLKKYSATLNIRVMVGLDENRTYLGIEICRHSYIFESFVENSSQYQNKLEQSTARLSQQ